MWVQVDPLGLSELVYAPWGVNDIVLRFVVADPCEYHNIADKHPDIVTKLVTRLKDYQVPRMPCRLETTYA